MSIDIAPVFSETVADIEAGAGEKVVYASQNFAIAYWNTATGTEVAGASEYESMLLLPEATGTLEVNGSQFTISEKSVVVIPAGEFRFTADSVGQVVWLQSAQPDEVTQAAANATHYARKDDRILPATPTYRRIRDAGSVSIYQVDDLATLPHAARTRMLQSESLSINWVEYRGERDPSSLSPHNHSNIEQASLGLSGQFAYHLRVPWTPDSTLWRPDRHDVLDAPCIGVFPVGLIHTVTGTADSGHNLLIDVFSPVRTDFVEKGWIANSHQYELL